MTAEALAEVRNRTVQHAQVYGTVGLSEAEADREALLLEVERLHGQLDQLLADSQKLNALECAGVDNWEGYSEAIELLDEWQKEDEQARQQDGGGSDG